MIYLASPYSHPDWRVREQRFVAACRATAALLRAGVNTISPIAHSHPVARFGVSTSWEFWARLDCELLSRCDVLAVLTLSGWRESIGVQAEIKLARGLGLPVVFVSPCELLSEELDPPSPSELNQPGRRAEPRTV